MSYYYRENPKLSDKLRHKSGNDLLQKIKQQFDEDNNAFFEPRSARNNFERHAELPRGFPFDEEKGGLGQRNDIRSHLDELAARHPEFADHLLGSPWDIPFQGPLRNRRQSNQNYPEDDTRSQASGSSGASGASSHGESEPVNGHEVRSPRSTLEARQMEMDPQRNQRSMSAPPENRQQTQTPNRYVSKVEIQPQAQQQPQQQQKEKSPTPQPQSNVRHIPIFVEGRDTPVLPKNPEPEPATFQRQPSPPTFRRPSAFTHQGFGSRPHRQWPPEFQDAFFNRDRDQFDGPRWGSTHAQPHQTFPREQQFRQQPNEKPRGFHPEPPQQQHYPQQQHPQQHFPQQHPQQQQSQPQPPPQPEPAEPPKPKPQTLPKDPLERVALVQQEVDSLTEQVKAFSGTSRQDKQYMYLDEMLTRELIKLDDIETEGKENVRLARKNAIKSIQESISLLESKVPLPQEQVEEAIEEDQTKLEESVPEETMVTESQPQETNASQPSAIPLPPCTSAPAEVPTEKQEEQPVTTDEKNEVPVPMDDQTEKARSDMPMEVQANTEEAVAVEAAAVPCEQPVKEAETTETKPELLEIPAEVEQQSAEKPMSVEVAEDTQAMEVSPVKSPKKVKKMKKKSTPISEQAIPLPPPEPKI